jgi:hypothetical protein
MLLGDGSPNAAADLQVYEMAILDVAHTEGMDLDVKLTLATEEISEDVLDILLDHTRSTVFPESNLRRARGVTDVVVTPPMKRWHALHTLAVVYRDAFNNQLNDRYLAKWQEYGGLAKDARERTIKLGIGLALNPVPQAGAPVMGSVGGLGADGTFYVQVSWVSSSGQEGTPSEVTATGLTAGSNLTVQAVNPPAVATGYNVYAGASEAEITRQNSALVPVGQIFEMPDGGLVAGVAAGMGQAADVYITGGPLVRRG